MHRRHGPIALVHFDAHLDTWDTYFGAAYTHGTPFRRAWEEGLLLEGRAAHVGPRACSRPRTSWTTSGSASRSSRRWRCWTRAGRPSRSRSAPASGRAVYVSIDIDVLDPGFAPGTGTPEAGGITNRELLGILRGLAGVRLVGADIVEVSPPYDQAEITAVAASHAAYELLALFARARDGRA